MIAFPSCTLSDLFPSCTLSDLSAVFVSHASAGRKDGIPRKKINLVAVQETSRKLQKCSYPVKRSCQAKQWSPNVHTKKLTTHSTRSTWISQATKENNSRFFPTNFPVSLTSASVKNMRQRSKARTSSCCSSKCTAHQLSSKAGVLKLCCIATLKNYFQNLATLQYHKLQLI